MAVTRPPKGRGVTRLGWLGRLWPALVLAVCGGCDSAAVPPKRALVVFAAASLREGFIAEEQRFERLNPGVDVQLNFAGTPELRAQLEHGASADVFASADDAHMDALRAAGVTDAPVPFARNALVVVVSSEAAARVRRFEDLPNAARLVLGAADVPVGRYTARLLERADAALGLGFAERVEARVISRELNVRQVLAKVSLGEADAGVVYRSDALVAGGAVHTLEIPEALNVVTLYPIATLRRAAEPALAAAWVRALLTPEGQDSLAAAGFGRVTPL